MPALFPNSVRLYTRKTDLVDTVLADHVNLLQDEMTATQNTLGTSLLSSSWSGTYSNPSTHASVSARMLNIEAGLTSLSTLKANLASPSLTGTPTSPTASVDNNTTQIATTAFVLGQASSSTPLVNGTAAVGTSSRYARADHVHGTDTSRASQSDITTLTSGLAAANADIALRITRANGSVTAAAVNQNVVRNITLSTAEPTSGAGSAGDVWFRYV